MVGTWAHGDHWQCNFVYSSPILANSTPNCIYCLQEVSSWDWLSCQTHRTCVIWKNTWLLRPLYKSAMYCQLWLTYFNWRWLFWLNKCSKDDHNLQEGCLEPGICSFGGRAITQSAPSSRRSSCSLVVSKNIITSTSRDGTDWKRALNRGFMQSIIGQISYDLFCLISK